MLPDLLYSGNASVLVLPFSSTDPHVPPPERRPQVELSTPSLAHTYPMIAQTTPTGIFQMEGQYPMEVVVRDEGRVMEPRLSGMMPIYQPVESLQIADSELTYIHGNQNILNHHHVRHANFINAGDVSIQSQTIFPGPQFADFISPGAAYNSGERSPPPRCHPGTQTTILGKIHCWVDDKTPSTSILWLHALAGAGKSAIAQTIADQSAEHGQLAASFFFAKSGPQRNAKQYLLPTIALQIAAATHDRREKLITVLSGDSLTTRYETIVVPFFTPNLTRVSEWPFCQ